MAADPKIEKHADTLQGLPPEFQHLAEWGWLELRQSIVNQAIALGVDPLGAHRIGARLARLVVTQMYGDVKRYRLFGQEL